MTAVLGVPDDGSPGPTATLAEAAASSAGQAGLVSIVAREGRAVMESVARGAGATVLLAPQRRGFRPG